MKVLLSIFFSLSLSGCVLLDAFLMTKYDPNEYKIITEIRAQSHQFKETCEDTEKSKVNSIKIHIDTELFMMYSEHLPRNTDVQRASKELNEMAKELKDRYQKNQPVSKMFCKMKFDNIESSAKKMQSIIGSRPR